jgi:hypothetical protein
LSARPVLLRVLLFRESRDSHTWIAQALEHDIAAYGEDIEQAKLAFERTVSGYFVMATRHHREPLAGLPPAPDGFWDVWQRLADQQTMQAEPIPSIPGHMIPVVTDEPVQTAH